MPSAADPSTNNIGKEVAFKEIPPSSVIATHASGSFSKQVMLSTAIVLVYDSDGSAYRALLDCGSQANFVCKKFVEALGLETCPLNVSISDVNGTSFGQVARIQL